MSDPHLPETPADPRPSPSAADGTSAAPARPEAAAPSAGLPAPMWLDDLRRAVRGPVSWLWQGYLAAGSVTLLTSQWKSGKTTLVAVLLERLKQGGELAGQRLAPGKAVVVSEESPAQWDARSRKLDFGGHICWLCRPFRGKPSPQEWLGLIDWLVDLRMQHGIALVVVDALAAFLPGRDESNAGPMLEALTPLHRLTTLGASVLLLHHPRKGSSTAGMAARGSGALSGFVDIVIEMECCNPENVDDRRRRLRAYSRYDETPRQLILELTAEGTAYRRLEDSPEAEFRQGWQRLRMVLEDATGKRTRREILADWPEDFDKPEPLTLWRWLQQALVQGVVCQEGTGRRNAPYRYWLPGQEAKWRQSPYYVPELPELQRAQQVAEEVRRRLLEGLTGMDR